MGAQQRLEGTFMGTVTIGGTSSVLNGTFYGPVVVTGDNHSISGEFLAGLTILGDGNRVSANCHGNSGHGMIVKGNRNTVSGVFLDNQGDGIRVDGGALNKIDVLGCTGNQGNGLTLTGGADQNQVRITTGTTDRITGKIEPGSGNRGHGVALIADASWNVFRSIEPGCGGNLLDGVHLVGENVRGNSFLPFHSVQNGGNGFSLLRGARTNELGDPIARTSVLAEGNGQHGVFLSESTATTVIAESINNGGAGVCMVDVAESEIGDSRIELDTRNHTADSSPASVGLRLEGWTENVVCTVNLLGHKRGIELLGAEVARNHISGTVMGSRAEGIYISKAVLNQLDVRVEGSGGDGIRMEGAIDNLIRTDGINSNVGIGIHLLAGSSRNQITVGRSSFVSRNRTGIVMADGARANRIRGLTVTANLESGFRFHGGATTGNSVEECASQGHPRFGVEVLAGANDIRFGDDLQNASADRRTGNLSANQIAGALVSGAESSLVLQRCFISGVASLDKRQPIGVRVEGGGSALLRHNTFFRHATGVAVQGAGRSVALRANTFAEQFQQAIRIEQTQGVTIGGPAASDANNIYQTQGTAIELTGVAPTRCEVWNNDLSQNSRGIEFTAGAHENTARLNRITGNEDGIVLTGATNNTILDNRISQNLLTGVLLRAGAASNRVSLNQLEMNGTGIKVDGSTTLHNPLLQNRITANNNRGILLSNGGNAARPAPVLSKLDRGTLHGSASAPDGSRVEVFTDPGHQGQSFRGTATVAEGRFSLSVNFSPAEVGTSFNITATVTDLASNTSEFGSFKPDEPEETEPAPPRIAFTSTRYGNPRIYLLDQGQSYDLTPDGFSNQNPSAGCGCSSLLFVSNRDAGARPENLDIYLMEPRNGAPISRITTHNASDYDPAWLHGCESLIFVSERDGNPEIYTMNPDGTGLTRLTDDPAVDREPAWSPDGSSVYFASNRPGVFELYRVPRLGGAATRVSVAYGDNSQPALSAP